MNLDDLGYFSEGSKPLGAPGAPSDTADNPRPRQMTIPGMREELLPRPEGPSLSVDQFSGDRPAGFPTRPLGQKHVGMGNPVPDTAREEHVEDYNAIGGFGAWGPNTDRDSLMDNPLFEDGSVYRSADFNATMRKDPGPYERGEQTEYMPTWKAVSEQHKVNPAAVDHIAANANTNALERQPDVTSYYDKTTGEEKYLVNDGHHRIIGAQNQGRLFLPVSNFGWRSKREQRDDWVPER